MEEITINKCSEIIGSSKHIVVLTGAGISTESGIRDFRSRTGIYQCAPEKVLSLDYFYHHPSEFYEFAIEHLYHPQALPNDGHKILAKWEEEGRVQGIITQNIDELHLKAGSKRIIEFHGTMKTAKCMNCGEKYCTSDLVEKMKAAPDFYICHHCKTYHVQERYIKPDVVLFGEAGDWFTHEGFNTIIQEIKSADCILVLGTSLKVTPFSHFPQYRRQGVPLIIVNKGTTPYDSDYNTYVIQESIGKTLMNIEGLITK